MKTIICLAIIIILIALYIAVGILYVMDDFSKEIVNILDKIFDNKEK